MLSISWCIYYNGEKVKGEQHEEKETKTNAKTIASESTKERISYISDQLNDLLMQQLKDKKKELQVREEKKRQQNWKESVKNKKNVKRINHLKNC